MEMSPAFVTYFCSVEVSPKGSFPFGTMLTVGNIQELVPNITLLSQPDACNDSAYGDDECTKAILHMDVTIDFSGYILGGDPTDELMEVCALGMRGALLAQMVAAADAGHEVHKCQVIYRKISFRECGLFQYPMQRVVEGLLGVVPGVLFDVLAPPTSPINEVEESNTSNTPLPAASIHFRPTRCALSVRCDSLDFGVNLFHSEYLTAFADELAWVIGSTSRLSREVRGVGYTALLDLANCAVSLNYCTEITPSNICQIVGTCLRAVPTTPSSVEGGTTCHLQRPRFSIDISGGTIVPLVADTSASWMMNSSGPCSPMVQRKQSAFRLVVSSPRDDGDDSSYPPTTGPSPLCWRLQLLETLEYELIYLISDGLLKPDGSDLPAVTLDGFLDFPEGYTLEQQKRCLEEGDSSNRNLAFDAEDGGASMRAILSSFAKEFPTACRCIQVPLTARRANEALPLVSNEPMPTSLPHCVVATFLSRDSSPVVLSSSPSPPRSNREKKPLEDSSPFQKEAEEGGSHLYRSHPHRHVVSPSPKKKEAVAAVDGTRWCSLEDVARIVTFEVARGEGEEEFRKQTVLLEGIVEQSLDRVSESTVDGRSPEQKASVLNSVVEEDEDVDIEGEQNLSSIAVDNDRCELSLHHGGELGCAAEDYDDNNSAHSSIGRSQRPCSPDDDSSPKLSHPTSPSSNAAQQHLSMLKNTTKEDSRLVPPSRRRLMHATHSLAEAEHGLGACLDSCQHHTSASPSRVSTVGPHRGGKTSPSRSASEIVAAPSPPHSRFNSASSSPSRSPSAAADPAVIRSATDPAVIRSATDERNTATVTVVHTDIVDEVMLPVVFHNDGETPVASGEAVVVVHKVPASSPTLGVDTCEINPSPDRLLNNHWVGAVRGGSLVPVTPNRLNSTLPPGSGGGVGRVGGDEQGNSDDFRSISRVSSIAPTRTTSPVDGRRASFSRNQSAYAAAHHHTVVTGTSCRTGANRGCDGWDGGTVYMMADVERIGPTPNPTPRSKTVISTVHIHSVHAAPRINSSASRSQSAASSVGGDQGGGGAFSRVASISPIPNQPYPNTSSTFRTGSLRTTSSIALYRQGDIQYAQVHAIKTVRSGVPRHPQPLPVQLTSRPVTPVLSTAPPVAAKTTMIKKTKKGVTKKASSKRVAKTQPSPSSAPHPAPPPTFFQGILDRHERIKSEMSVRGGGLHKVRKSEGTRLRTPSSSPPLNLPSQANTSRAASVSPAPTPVTTAAAQHPPFNVDADYCRNSQEEDSLAEAIRRHQLLYAPRPVPIPVTDQCQAGLARCISSRRSTSVAAEIHVNSRRYRSLTPRDSQPTSRSSSATAPAPVVSATIQNKDIVLSSSHAQNESPQSCWSEGAVEGRGMQMSRSPSHHHSTETHTTTTTTTPPTATSSLVIEAPAAVAIHRTSSVQVRVRRPSLHQL